MKNIQTIFCLILFLAACTGRPTPDPTPALQVTPTAQPTKIAPNATAVSSLATRVDQHRAPTLTPVPAMPQPTPTRSSQSTRIPTTQSAMYSISPRANWAPYIIRLVRNPQAPSPNTTDMNWKGTAGWIEVSKDGTHVDQRIEVRLQNPITDWTHFGLLAEDINFDTYTDIAVAVDFGAKWGRWEWWLFDPRSGLYTQTPLSREISALVWNEHRLDPQARELRIQNFTGACPHENVYRVEPDHIVFSRTEGYTITAQACVPLSSLQTPTASPIR